MPPHLDLSKTYTHGDMLLSPRNSPRISLRRVASHNSADRGPQSSTSACFSFNHLIASPPPSPGLPALVPRHGKPAPKHTPRRFLRAILWLVGVLVIVYYGFSMVTTERPLQPVGWATNAGDQYEMVGESELPDFPTPVVITDKRGRARWTVSIPPASEFPLEPAVYAEICIQNTEVAMHVADLHTHSHREHAAHYDYYHVDPNFMDVAEAEAHGLLPGSRAEIRVKEQNPLVGEQDGLMEEDVCEKSMTFLLETADAGLGKTLMMLWTAYGLAQKEGRAFFIDDTRWAYGRYTSFFQPPPMPSCRPPPRHEMLPCPHHARHLVVSAATVSSTFGGAFNDHFEDARKMEVYRQKPIFEFARAGYEALFKLSTEDDNYVSTRIASLRDRTKSLDPSIANGMVIGIHVRHGDRHPYEFQYRDSYVPLDRYSSMAGDILHSTFNDSGPNGDANVMARMHSLMVVASDDPDVYASDEFSQASRAQDLIALASRPPAPAPPAFTPIRRFVEENIGWEGGFFAGMFWSLGRTAAVPADARQPPTADALRLRELVGRAYLLDLAVLGGASDRLVCTVSATGCNLLAVMMGWERAIVQGGWTNIDGDFEWRGVAW